MQMGISVQKGKEFLGSLQSVDRKRNTSKNRDFLHSLQIPVKLDKIMVQNILRLQDLTGSNLGNIFLNL